MFKFRISPLVNLVLPLTVLLSGCGKGVLDVQIIPPAQPTITDGSISRSTDLQPSVAYGISGDELAQIQPIALSFLAGGVEDRQPFLQYETTSCSIQPGLGQPTCLPGESEGQDLKVFPLGADQPAYLRLEDIHRRLDFQVKELYAVYRFPVEQNGLPLEQRGDYGLLFDHETGGQPEPVVAVVAGGRLVRLEFYTGKSLDEVLNRVPVAQVILPPQQAHAWSELLQDLKIQSQVEVSPDMRWVAQTTVALPAQEGEEYYRQLTVANQDGYGSSSYTLVDEWATFDANYTLPRPLAWFGMSPTELPVVYWTFAPALDDCEVFHNGSSLHRLDLESGLSQTLLDNVGTWLSVSPDQGRAAVIAGNQLGIYNLSSGQGRFTELPAGSAGQVIWSPDGREVVLTIADDSPNESCTAARAATHTILRIDANTLEVKLRLANDARRLVTQSWSQLGLIKLTDAESRSWLLDPLTGEVWDARAERPTPIPNPSRPAQIRFFANLYEADVAALRKLAVTFAAENPGMQVVFSDPAQISASDSSDNNYLASWLSTSDCFVDWMLPGEYDQGSKLLLDLGPLLTASGAELSRDYWPEQLNGYRLDGKLYGLPMFEAPSMIHFNTDLLAQKKLPVPEPDWTFDDFIALLTAISSGQSGDKIYGFYADEGSLGQLSEGLFTPIFDTSTKPLVANFVSPEMAVGLDRLTELRRSGAFVYIPATLFAGEDYYDMADAWLDGRVAFWQIPFGETSPFPAVEQLPTFQTAVAPLPAHGSLFRNGYSVQQGFYIGKNTPNAEACWRWYQYVTSHPETNSRVPARRSMIENTAWRARVGESNATALRIGIERVYTEPSRFSTLVRPEDPLINWLFGAIIGYLNGAEAQKVMGVAQAKADVYTACMSSQITLTGEALRDAVLTCVRQADPGDSW